MNPSEHPQMAVSLNNLALLLEAESDLARSSISICDNLLYHILESPWPVVLFRLPSPDRRS